MLNYLKICSSVEIAKNALLALDGRFLFDYDRQEDDPDEVYRYEYFFEPYEEDEESDDLGSYEDSATALIQHLIETIGSDNFVATNMTGIYIEGC